jgi:hypothetical protein
MRLFTTIAGNTFDFSIILLLPYIIKIILIRSTFFFLWSHLACYIFQISEGRRES